MVYESWSRNFFQWWARLLPAPLPVYRFLSFPSVSIIKFSVWVRPTPSLKLVVVMSSGWSVAMQPNNGLLSFTCLAPDTSTCCLLCSSVSPAGRPYIHSRILKFVCYLFSVSLCSRSISRSGILPQLEGLHFNPVPFIHTSVSSNCSLWSSRVGVAIITSLK